MKAIPTQPNKVFLTMREAIDYARCCDSTLRRAVRSKALPHHRIGQNENHGPIRIRMSDLEEYLNRNRVNGKA